MTAATLEDINYTVDPSAVRFDEAEHAWITQQFSVRYLTSLATQMRVQGRSETMYYTPRLLVHNK